ncbi:MAG TPA: DEAD/DEAH box helicase [Sedimentibacter sp.]|nr:DEAD/DEAH box helicase [Sedimentibacter sp.]
MSDEFEKLSAQLPLDRQLYAHQQKAVEKIIREGRNIVVATGTGSGKTECFMLPIIDYLMKQKKNGKLDKGVRALLLYPMNALANDQMKRLRDMLGNYPDITFGRFTGETEEEEDKAAEIYKKMYPGEKRLINEIISRVEMRKNPPHILLTNYAMLEYLLLRPSDNVFFDGDYAHEWKFIVLDEAHTYNGAKGTEISMLLKRLKQRITFGEEGRIKCIATSATLGGGKDSYAEVADFAQSIFSEPFTGSDIIESQRVNLIVDSGKEIYHQSSYYNQLNELYESEQYNELYNKLRNDGNVLLLQRELSKSPQLLADLAKLVFNEENMALEDKENVLVNIVNLCAAAKNTENDMPLLPARYHVFVKTLEGAYVSLYPQRKLFMDRHLSYRLPSGMEVPVFELANCQRCGQEYLVGTTENEKLVHIKTHVDVEGMYSDKAEFYVLDDECSQDELDDDEIVFDINPEKKGPKYEEYLLCCACGHIERFGAARRVQCCPHPDSKYIKVLKVKMRESKVNTCIKCGAHSPDIVKRFLTADDPATEVLTKTLYQCIIPKKVEKTNQKEPVEDEFFLDFFDSASITKVNSNNIEQGRKLLIFSDSRQEAAFFATYLNLKYNQVLWRNTILRVMQELKDYKDIRIESVVQRLLDYGNKNTLFPATIDELEKSRMIYSYIMKEFIAIERQIGLEGLGLISFAPRKPLRWGNLPDQNYLGVDMDGMWEIYCVLFDTLRTKGAVSFPKDLAPTDEFFAPRNRNVYFKLSSQESFRQSTVLGWLPREKTSNSRLDYIKKLLVKRGMSLDEAKHKAQEILGRLMHEKIIKYFINESYIKETVVKNEGVLFQLNHEMWNIAYKADRLFRCSVCGTITNHNINGVCPTYRCEGELKEYNGETTRFTYYKELYEDMKPIPMVAREHTAQLTSECASKLQNQFEKGEVNILSCSTTFEMGVDVGQLEAVFMRNVPPETANYVQRAGRAGRRTESTAFSLTYAKRRSHDLTYYQYPQEIIAGKIKPPYIEKGNDKIIQRHLYSVVFAWFFKRYSNFFGTVDDFFNYTKKGVSAIDILRDELEKKPRDLLEALKIVVPPRLHDYYGLFEWSWVEKLLGEDNGALITAKSFLFDILDDLSELENKLHEERKDSYSVQKIINTYLGKGVLDFLSSNNILPKYGFPVDVVDLTVLHHGAEAKSISLDRDLKIAISEFAPGSEIVANGKVWKPYAVNKSSTRGWPVRQYAICATCKKIYKYETDLGQDIEEKEKTCCGEELTYYKYIVPVFGFSTNIEAPKEPGEKRAVKSYPTQVIFDAFVDEGSNLTDTFVGAVKVGAIDVSYKYSSRGRLVLLNQGPNKTGFRVCKNCGYMTKADNSTLERHKTKTGDWCHSKFLYSVHFGHDFITDVLELRLPLLSRDYIKEGFWLSLLYAILEGASIALGISRKEINGCLYYNDENTNNIPSLMLFDDVPGGAGHVKKISQNILEVLRNAKRKVSGACGCGEETSCYGCLRNYGNQLFHENLVRGLPLYYLNDILNSENVDESESEIYQSISDECRSVIDFVRENDISMPQVNFVIKDNFGRPYIAPIAWSRLKIALFDGISESYIYFKNNGYICFDISSMAFEDLTMSLKQNIG